MRQAVVRQRRIQQQPLQHKGSCASVNACVRVVYLSWSSALSKKITRELYFKEPFPLRVLFLLCICALHQLVLNVADNECLACTQWRSKQWRLFLFCVSCSTPNSLTVNMTDVVCIHCHPFCKFKGEGIYINFRNRPLSAISMPCSVIVLP